MPGAFSRSLPSPEHSRLLGEAFWGPPRLENWMEPTCCLSGCWVFSLLLIFYFWGRAAGRSALKVGIGAARVRAVPAHTRARFAGGGRAAASPRSPPLPTHTHLPLASISLCVQKLPRPRARPALCQRCPSSAMG